MTRASDDIVWALIRSERTCLDPAAELSVIAEDFEKEEHGGAWMPPAGHWIFRKDEKILKDVIATLDQLGIEVEDYTADGESWVLMKLSRVRDVARRCRYAAPWFIDWYVSSSLVDTTIRGIVGQLHKASLEGDMIYRGEDKLYGQLNSSMSRYLGTNDPGVIASQIRYNRLTSKPLSAGYSDESVQGTFQHLGGESNLIDFTSLVWIAVHFAVRESDSDIGRVWGLRITTSSLTITGPANMDNMVEDIASRRQQAQHGWFVESATGVIQERDLSELATIAGELKPAVREFLGWLGINDAALFPDLAHHLENREDGIPFLVFLQLMIDWIRNGRHVDVVRATDTVAAHYGKESQEAPSCQYLRGLAMASSGDYTGGFKDVREAKRLLGSERASVEIMNKNLAALTLAKSRRVRPGKISLDLTLWKELWWSAPITRRLDYAPEFLSDGQAEPVQISFASGKLVPFELFASPNALR